MPAPPGCPPGSPPFRCPALGRRRGGQRCEGWRQVPCGLVDTASRQVGSVCEHGACMQHTRCAQHKACTHECALRTSLLRWVQSSRSSTLGDLTEARCPHVRSTTMCTVPPVPTCCPSPPEVGSSRNSTEGAPRIPAAMPSLLLSPPDRPRKCRPPGSTPPTCKRQQVASKMRLQTG